MHNDLEYEVIVVLGAFNVEMHRSRMEAAKIIKEEKGVEVIVTGGYDRNSEDSKEIDDVEDYIQQLQAKVVKTLPCSRHNLIAAYNKFTLPDAIGLVTNHLHLPRVMRLAIDLQSEYPDSPILVPISSDAVTGRCTYDDINLEMNALCNIELGFITDHCIEEDFGCKDVIDKYTDILLSPKEKMAWMT